MWEMSNRKGDSELGHTETETLRRKLAELATALLAEQQKLSPVDYQRP